MIKALVGLVLFVGLSLGMLFVCKRSIFGTSPSAEYQKKFKGSPNYNETEGVFLNRRPHLLKEMRARLSWFTIAKEWSDKGIDRIPLKPLPQHVPDMQEFMKPSSDLKLVWFGHSTVLLNMNGKIILIDPVFSAGAAPFVFLVPRFQKPVLSLEELPEVDYIVISHDHYDHLDMESIQFFKNKKNRFVVPLGVGSHLMGWGVPAERITELDWWEGYKDRDLEFIATPAQHFSGRTGIKNDTTLWASWVLRNGEKSIYFSGDSGYDDHFKEIGDKYGPFDLAFLENGQYNDKWPEVHMHPEETIDAYFDLKAQRYFPIHWAMFKLAYHPWYDPVTRIQKAAKGKEVHLVTPIIGEVVVIGDRYVNKTWWDDLVK